MNWIENLLIIFGISLDIFAAVECQGSLVAKINKKNLCISCALVAVWQAGALFVGYFLSGILYKNAKDETFMGLVIAAVIFFCLGIRLIVKAIRNERIVERREDMIGFKKILQIAAVTSIYTVLTGIAFGFLGTNPVLMLGMIVGLTIIVVVSGMYTGYHFGFEQKTKAYVGGAVLLWIAGIDVIFRHIVMLG